MSVLAEICAKKRDHITACQATVPLAQLKEKIAIAAPPRGFAAAIRKKIAAGQPALIAEIKKASPSVGLIRPNFDPAALATAYEHGGAACLSVLTDTPYFQGQDTDLAAARETCALPVLRKDFMLDPYQVFEARALGADCILIIMAALSDSEARTLHDCAGTLGMDALVEVHDALELNRAVALNPALLGVNSRDLKTLKVDLATAEKLSPAIPAGAIKIAESGIHTAADRIRLQAAGYTAFLVGESLMRQPDVTHAARALLAT